MRRYVQIALVQLIVAAATLAPSVAAASAPPGSEPEARAEEPRERLFAPRRDIVGWIDVNAYADTRGFSQLTINSFALLPYGFEYFGFIDFVGYPWLWSSEDSTFPDIYSEQNLTWSPVPKLVPLDLSAQWAILNPASISDRARLGLRWRVSDTPGIARVCSFLNLWFITNIFVADLSETIGDGSGYPLQLSHAYRWDIAPKTLQRRLYVSGFMDQNLCVGECALGHHRIVTEHQLGIRIVGGLHVVGELKYNDYYDPRFGFAGGLEYVIAFAGP